MDTSSVRKSRARLAVAIVLAALAALLGVVLLVAGKTGAGLNVIIAAALIAAPLGRLGEKYRWLGWLRIALVVLLFIVAIVNISNTDIPPNADVTGLKFIDQLLAIFNRFADIVFGQ